MRSRVNVLSSWIWQAIIRISMCRQWLSEARTSRRKFNNNNNKEGKKKLKTKQEHLISVPVLLTKQQNIKKKEVIETGTINSKHARVFNACTIAEAIHKTHNKRLQIWDEDIDDDGCGGNAAISKHIPRNRVTRIKISTQ